MPRAFALFLAGIGCLSFSLGLTFAIVDLWVFSNVPGGGYVSMKSIMYWLYLSFVSVVVGAVGGYLIGRYLHVKESSIEKA